LANLLLLNFLYQKNIVAFFADFGSVYVPVGMKLKLSGYLSHTERQSRVDALILKEKQRTD
jgi:hypothetical protein